MYKVTLEAAVEKLQKETDLPFTVMLRHGSMTVEYYAPVEADKQTPHLQDELYVIASGNSMFYRDGERTICKAGDVLFVPAGMEHRFENFSSDFATWVIFYGPSGGEAGKG
jgi:mannose-6-phosphate isomerase-like protein (cupin superfamily)